MANNLTHLRDVIVTIVGESRMEVLVCEDGKYWLHELADRNCDGLVEIADDTDEALSAVLREMEHTITPEDDYRWHRRDHN